MVKLIFALECKSIYLISSQFISRPFPNFVYRIIMKYWCRKDQNVSNYFHSFHWLINRINYAFSRGVGMFIYDAVSFQIRLRTSCNCIFASAGPPRLSSPRATLMARHIHWGHVGFQQHRLCGLTRLHSWVLFGETFSFHFGQSRLTNVCDINWILLHHVIHHATVLASWLYIKSSVFTCYCALLLLLLFLLHLCFYVCLAVPENKMNSYLCATHDTYIWLNPMHN